MYFYFIIIAFLAVGTMMVFRFMGNRHADRQERHKERLQKMQEDLMEMLKAKKGEEEKKVDKEK